MLGLLRRVVRLRGPAGVLALAAGVGLGAGILATHAVLAAWTYRDASRRDLRAPGRWALATLVTGIGAFVPYVALQRASDWSRDSGSMGAVRRALGSSDPEGTEIDVEPADADGGREREASVPEGDGEREASVRGGDGEREASVPADGGETAHGGRSLARRSARLGWRAARLGGRGVRRAAGIAVRRRRD